MNTTTTLRSGLRWFSATVIAAFLLLGCSPKEEKKIALGDFHLTTLEGVDIDMGKYQGKRVFINVWATWCKPCVQEMPTIAAAMKEVEGSGVVFLFASSEEAEEIIGFRDRKGFPFEYVRLLNLEALSIQALPATFIFDSEGQLVYGEEGFRDWSAPENMKFIRPTVE